MKEDRPAKIGFDTSGIGKVVGKVVSTVEGRADKCSDGFVKNRQRFSRVGDILECITESRIKDPDVSIVIGGAVWLKVGCIMDRSTTKLGDIVSLRAKEGDSVDFPP